MDQKEERHYVELFGSSHKRVLDEIAKARGELAMKAYNLDTNLPAATQTYALADETLKDLGSPAESVFFPYAKLGKEVRDYFSQRVKSRKELKALLTQPEFSEKAAIWLEDIYPHRERVSGMRVSVRDQCPPKGRRLRLPAREAMVFILLREKLCIPKGARFVEIIYGLGMADGIRHRNDEPEGGWGAAYLEAVDRLRLAQ